jgi:hypothetical protein
MMMIIIIILPIINMDHQRIIQPQIIHKIIRIKAILQHLVIIHHRIRQVTRVHQVVVVNHRDKFFENGFEIKTVYLFFLLLWLM